MKRNRPCRRSVLSSLAVLVFGASYLLFSVGVLKATHFCNGREASIAYFTAEAHQCGCSISADEDATCCDDRQDLLRIDDSQTSLSMYQLSPPVLAFLGALYRFSCEQIRGPVNHRPALKAQPPPKILYKVFCSFVFYGDGSIV